MADTKLSALDFGTTATHFYGQEGGASKKYAGYTIYNVKDFGALGNSTNGVDGNDDTAEIQAAIDASGDAASGIIFFPRGLYRITGPLLFTDNNHSIIFAGIGGSNQVLDGSMIIGSLGSNYLIERTGAVNTAAQHTLVIRDLVLRNTNTTGGGAIRIDGTVGGAIRDCYLKGFKGVYLSDTCEILLDNVQLGCITTGKPSGSFGIAAGGNSAAYNCDVTGFDHGVRVSGNGFHWSGGRIEINGTGLLLGMDGDGNTSGSRAFSMTGTTFEGNATAIGTNGGNGHAFFGGISIQGDDAVHEYGINIGANGGLHHSVIAGCSLGGLYDNYAVQIGDNQEGLIIMGMQASNSGGSGIYNIADGAGVQFIGVDYPLGEAPASTYANRPTSATRCDGDLWKFSDSSTATFGGEIAGSGANRVIGRYSIKNDKWYVAGLDP